MSHLGQSTDNLRVRSRERETDLCSTYASAYLFARICASMHKFIVGYDANPPRRRSWFPRSSSFPPDISFIHLHMQRDICPISADNPRAFFFSVCRAPFSFRFPSRFHLIYNCESKHERTQMLYTDVIRVTHNRYAMYSREFRRFLLRKEWLFFCLNIFNLVSY